MAGRQTRMRGMEKKRQDVTDAALDYRKKMLARKKMLEKEVAAKEHLMSRMVHHKLKVYEDSDEGLRVTFDKVEKLELKVKQMSDADITVEPRASGGPSKVTPADLPGVGGRARKKAPAKKAAKKKAKKKGGARGR